MTLTCQILSLPDIAARLSELVVANYVPFTDLSHLSLPNVRRLQLSGEYGAELNSLPELPRCRALDLDMLEFSITSVATLHRFLNLATMLVELRVLNEFVVWDGVLSQVTLDDDYLLRFQHLKKATFDLPTFMTFHCILPSLTKATVVVTHREQHHVPLLLPIIPSATHFSLEDSKSTVAFTSRTLTVSSDLAVATPRLKTLSCEIPVEWAHPLAHCALTSMTTPVFAWNRLRGRMDLPVLKSLAFVTFTRALQDIEHVDPASVPALTEIVLPRGGAVMADALWDMTRLPALESVRADPPVCFGPSLAEMRLLYTATSARAVWPLVSIGATMGTVAHCTIFIPTADVELDVALVEATVAWMLLQRALSVCLEVPVDVEQKLGVQAFVDAMQAKFDTVTIDVELLPASDVKE
ncbi:hypothetical protein GGF32_003231 [Allomyces javanicus]|nr:hypothetical protein GGF32_003231 [Allomyces javanicus]